MSGFVTVRLDVLNDQEREGIARTLAQWLVEREVIAPLDESLWRSAGSAFGEWGPGMRWVDAVDLPLPEAWESSPGEEVDISAERTTRSAMENYEDFTCGRCGNPLPDDDQLGDLIVGWIEHREPMVACSRCGWDALLGDWPSEGPPGLVGAPSVTFYRWPPLRAEFVTDLAAFLGGRCRSFWTHF